MNDSPRDSAHSDALETSPATPRFRPSERFWPYVELPEQPTAEELASLDPDLHDALFGPRARPFSLTLVFPRFEGADYDSAIEMAKAAAECREVGQGDSFRVRARFLPSEARTLKAVFEIVSQHDGCEVLIDDRPMPHARELWLPLLWFLLPH